MNLEELRSVQDAERGRSDLQPLPESFYEDAGEYVAELKAERDRAAAEAEDPFSSPEVRRLTDEIETAEEVVEAVYERRLGKIVERASLAAADLSVDEDGLTVEERALFRDLVDRMEASKRTVLDALDPEEGPEAGADGPAEGSASTASAEGPVGGDDLPPSADGPVEGDSRVDRPGGGTDAGELSAATVMGGETDRQAAGTAERDDDGGGSGGTGGAGESLVTGDRTGGPSSPTRGEEGSSGSEPESTPEPGLGPDSTPDADRVTVRITRDVGRFLGVDDREYDLAAEDVVRLPVSNADPLVDRGAAERLD